MKKMLANLNLPQFNSLEELLSNGFGYSGNIFFSNNEDWSKVLFFFNGAVTSQKLEISRESAIFQRWSWHKNFRHPIFCIADPLTYGSDAIPVGWYQGVSNNKFLIDQISVIKNALALRVDTFKSVAFGSSAGGYAALLSAQLGLVDSVIAINPQTDILKFFEKNALNAFLNRRNHLGLEAFIDNYSLLNTGFSQLHSLCEITYLQNVCDQSHYSDHMIPYVENLLKSKSMSCLNLLCFKDSTLGHNPPDIDGLSKIIGSPFTSLLKNIK